MDIDEAKKFLIDNKEYLTEEEQGIIEVKFEIAENMIKEKMSLDDILRATLLPKVVVEEIIRNNIH